MKRTVEPEIIFSTSWDSKKEEKSAFRHFCQFASEFRSLWIVMDIKLVELEYCLYQNVETEVLNK